MEKYKEGILKSLTVFEGSGIRVPRKKGWYNPNLHQGTFLPSRGLLPHPNPQQARRVFPDFGTSVSGLQQKLLLGVILTAEPRKSSTRHGERLCVPTQAKSRRYSPYSLKQSCVALISLVLRKEVSGSHPQPQLSLPPISGSPKTR